MSYRSTQMRFTIGEIDPLMTSRIDTDFYYSAADTMTNVICLPEGGFKRRPGLKHLDRVHRVVSREASPVITLPSGGTPANINDNNTSTYSVTTTGISTYNPYIVAHYDLGSAKDIAFVDVVDATITTSTNSEWFVQVSTNDVDWVTAGGAITLSPTETTQRRRVRGSYRYVRFVRIGITDLGAEVVSQSEFNVWTETATVSASKVVHYEFNTNQTYMFVFSDKNIAIYRDQVFQTDVRAPLYNTTRLLDLRWTSDGDTTLLFQEEVPVHKLLRHSDTNWSLTQITWDYIPKYNFDPVGGPISISLTPSAVEGKVTLTTSPGIWSAAAVNQYVEGNGGRARIINYVSAAVVDAIVEIPFYDTSTINPWINDSGWEDVWSSSRGYPRCGVFHQDRLWIGGSRDRPRTLWASRLGLYFDFDPGSLRDSDGIDYDLKEENPVVNLLSHRTLQIFTTGGEATITQARTQAITPTNPGIVTQTREGSEPGLQPVIVDGSTIFVKKGGKSLGTLIYNENELAYTSSNLSLFSSHLIDEPVDFSYRKSTNTEEASYLLIVNQDGTLSFGCVLTEQNVKGFTKATTDGTFTNVGVDGTTMYTIVQRTINSVDNKYLEIFDDSYYTDASTQVSTGLPTDTFTGLDQLEGKECRVRADGSIMDNETVSGGSVTLDRDVTELFEIGLNFNPTVITLPYANPEAAGDVIGKKKRIHEVILNIYETAGIIVNDRFVSFREFGGAGAGSPLNTPVSTYTGYKRISGLRGWDYSGQLTITQENPMPMTVLGVTTRVKV